MRQKIIVELASALRLHNKLITAAIQVFFKDQYTDKALAQFDFVNIMAYDNTGPWRPEIPGQHSSYAHAEGEYPGSESYDQLTMPDGRILYYNGIPTIKLKTVLAKEKASGIMIWELKGDAKGSKSLLKSIHKTIYSKK